MEIIRGVIPCAKKVVIYGPEGIGKSTFASKFPDPVFIDTEGSTNSMDVARLPKASSWQMLLDQVDYVRTHPTMCKTLVIDTIDWAESMCIRHICDKHRKSGIEDFGYGNGYVYVKEELGKFLNQLTEVVEAGVSEFLECSFLNLLRNIIQHWVKAYYNRGSGFLNIGNKFVDHGGFLLNMFSWKFHFLSYLAAESLYTILPSQIVYRIFPFTSLPSNGVFLPLETKSAL